MSDTPEEVHVTTATLRRHLIVVKSGAAIEPILDVVEADDQGALDVFFGGMKVLTVMPNADVFFETSGKYVSKETVDRILNDFICGAMENLGFRV